MKLQKILHLFPLLSLLYFPSISHAEEVSGMTKCEQYQQSALEKEKDLPDNFLEVCEMLETFKKVEAIVNAEKTELEENTLLAEREEILSEILEEENLTDSDQIPLEVFFDKNSNSTLDREVRSPGAAIEVNASTTNSNVAFQIGQKISSSFGGENQIGQFLTWSLRASSPLSNPDSTTVATLDGLANSTKLALNLNHFFLTGFKQLGEPDNTEDQTEWNKICTLAGVVTQPCSLLRIDQGLRNLDLSANQREAIYLRAESLLYEADSWNFGYNLNAEVGYENFEFVDFATQESKDQSEVPWSVGASFSVNPPTKFPLLFKLGFRYQEAFKAAGSQIVCPPSNGTDPVACNTGIFGGPSQRENLQLSFETRSILKGSALSLLVTHDFENDETGIDLPIYIVSDSKGNLNGGLRFGWTSIDDDDDLSVGVFIGRSFKFFD